MPQITKIRIANFQYNSGKRVIADELYDFENKEGIPSDVLINLVNGGGKSVLVQLMMQPIIPKAKVAGRKVESFFTKSTDHCYVVLEWSLDNSKMKLLTGIAMAASDTSADPDSDRGYQIKYYTFISSYQDNCGEYNIASLPLSKKENGRYTPASFDDIRNLAKKSNGKLLRYSSDDSVNWREKLSQYGIVQNEWRMIEELNSNEDGLSKYFANLKSSDVLIDTLIIPRIEEKQSHIISKDDSSLETMLISYAKNYNAQQNTIKEREVCKGFFDMLKYTKTESEELWKSNDSFEKSIEIFFAYSDAIENAIAFSHQEHERLETERQKLDKEKWHIQWEKFSAAYYFCKGILEKETDNLRNAEFEKNEAKRLTDEAKHKLVLMECAYYYAQLNEIESQIKSISSEMESREHHSKSSNKLAILKYSTYCAIVSELEQICPEIERLSENADNLKELIACLNTELSNICKKIAVAQTRADKCEAILDKQIQDNDKIVTELGIDAFRMLDGKYQVDNLDAWASKCMANIRSTESNLQMLHEKAERLDERKEIIPQKIADIKNEIKITENDFKTREKEIKKYFDAEAQVKELCVKYSIDFELRFTDYIHSYLLEQLSRTEADIKAKEREKETAEEALSAVNRGTLHIPKALTDYLDGTGLPYITFESYLLTQYKKGLLSADDSQKLLSKYPYAAYGVIINDSDIDSFLNETEDKWLPAMLPVFNAKDIECILSGDYSEFHTIAAYAQEYFLNNNEYAYKLQQSIIKQDQQLNLLHTRKEALLADILISKTFFDYDEGWISSELAINNKLESQISAKQDDISQLIHEKDSIKKCIAETRKDIEQQTSELVSYKNQEDTYHRLLKSIQEEEELYLKFQKEQKNLKELLTTEAKNSHLRDNYNTELANLESDLKELKICSDSLSKELYFVKNAEKTDIITDKWNILLDQYKALLEAQSLDLKHLNEKKNYLLKQKDDKEKEIKKRHCLCEEYVMISYSEEKETELEAVVCSCEKIYQEKNSAYTKAYREQGMASGRYEDSCKALGEYGGEPLSENEVGKSFDERIADINQKLFQLSDDRIRCETESARLEKTKGKTENIAENYDRPLKYEDIVLEQDYELQLSNLIKEIRTWQSAVDIGSQRVEKRLKEMADSYSESSQDINKAICSMRDLLSNNVIRGDRYFTLCEHIEANMHTLELRISQIDTDLTEFHKTKGDLVHQCVIQGKQMYEGLIQLSNNSKVKVQGKRRSMLCFDIPKVVDENIASVSISAEIDKGTQALVAKLNEEECTESEIRKIASRTVGSRRLLREYIGTEMIILRAYKIDHNPDNSGYRTWEQTQVNNSGAEKFVIYFAVILALMAYTRDTFDDIGSKQNRSVLILDNPFGPISSKHVLEPMFEISHNYNVQMICLSDISKSDIVSCFGLVIRAVVKQFALSTKEQLTHEGNEFIEHGFYKSEQLNMF